MGKVTGSVSVLPLSTWLIMKQLVNMNPFNQVTRLLNFRLPNLFVAVRPLKFPSESSIRLFIATFRQSARAVCFSLLCFALFTLLRACFYFDMLSCLAFSLTSSVSIRRSEAHRQQQLQLQRQQIETVSEMSPMRFTICLLYSRRHQRQLLEVDGLKCAQVVGGKRRALCALCAHQR